MLIKRSNFSDNIESGTRALYLQTHSEDDPPRAVSVLFQKGEVLGKRAKSLPADFVAKATESFHMKNIDEIDRLITISSNPARIGDTVKSLKTATLLIKWGLYQEALAVLEAVKQSQPGNIELLRLRGEVLTRLARYKDAAYILIEANKARPDESRTILFLILCLLNLIPKSQQSNKRNLLIKRVTDYLAKAKSLQPSLSGKIFDILNEVENKQYIRASSALQELLNDR